MTDTCASRRCLVVDDCDDMRFILREFLEQLGYEVTEGANGSAAIQHLQRGRFSLIITDLIMPDADGIDVISEAKAFQPGARIVGITGGGDYLCLDYCRRLMQQLGAQSVLTKPITFDQLLAAIGTAETTSSEANG